jgi:hypothetical protein
MSSRLRRLTFRVWCGRALAIALVAGVTAACNRPAVLTQLIDAQARTSALHVTFTRSIEASNRALMATDDATAGDAANESRNAAAAIDRQISELQQVLEFLAYQIELKRLDGFKARFEEYRRLNDDILLLVLENTNVKAQRLSFGPSAEAADAFHTAVESAVAGAPREAACAAAERAVSAWAALLEIRALYSRHIAEAEDAEMTRMETVMSAAATRARSVLEQLARQLPEAGRLTGARSALDRFMAVHAEILDLSRRNSNVRALALALGRKRTVAADAEAQIISVEEALKTHDFTATR